MAKSRRREPRGLISRYAAAVERGEDPGPLVFMRPGDDESIEDFVDRAWQQIEVRPLTPGERVDVRKGSADDERKNQKRRRRS